MKNTHHTIESGFEDEEKWDSQELGADEHFVKTVPSERARKTNESLNLSHISIRLPNEVIEQMKKFAKEDGLGYQPLIRQIVTKYVRERSHKKTA